LDVIVGQTLSSGNPVIAAIFLSPVSKRTG
jgi:hypothetical protein